MQASTKGGLILGAWSSIAISKTLEGCECIIAFFATLKHIGHEFDLEF